MARTHAGRVPDHVLVDLAGDGDQSRFQVDVAAAQLEKLALAQADERGG
jgi:hypothetical protein